jgi:hypothetical protein
MAFTSATVVASGFTTVVVVVAAGSGSSADLPSDPEQAERTKIDASSGAPYRKMFRTRGP